jgi:uncharacterized protein YxeA
MKKLLNILISFLLILPMSATLIFAQEITNDSSGDYTLQTEVDEATSKATNKYFDLTLSEGVQSPLNKNITYTLTIVPHLSSSKVQIIWDSSSTIEITPKHQEFVSVTDGNKYTYKAVIKPSASGTYKINASVIAWQYDTNYTNTVSNSLTLNDALVSQPMTIEYIILVVIVTLIILAIAGLSIWGGIEYSKKLLKKTKNWLTPPH